LVQPNIARGAAVAVLEAAKSATGGGTLCVGGGG